jgi:fructokinase
VTQPPLIAGVEIGGTKCICILARAPDDIVEQIRIETRDPAVTLAEIDAILDRWHDRFGFEALGIASFGPVDLERRSATYGTIVSTPKPGWSGTDLAGRWTRFAVPIGFDVDVVAAARAEQRWGAAQGLSDFAYITVGTGIGVGPIIAGRPVAGRGHCEMGHLRVPRLAGDEWPGCCPFHGDCVEGLASGVAIAARHGPGPVASDWKGWDSVDHALAALIHNLFVSLQPQRIMMGGGVAHGHPTLIERVRDKAIASLGGYYTASGLTPDFLVPPTLGESVGPMGSIAVGLGAVAESADA